MRGDVSLARAVRDKRLLGAAIGWYDGQLELFDLIAANRMFIGAIGRQSGKSMIAAAASTHNATMCPALDLVVPSGRIRYVLAVSPSEEQSREFIRLCEMLIEASPVLAPLADVQADRILFRIPRVRPDGSSFTAKTAIRALPANSRTIRGTSASMLTFDEFGHFQDSGGPGSDERVWAALMPSTRAFGDLAKIVVISTPDGPTGRFAELHNAATAGVMPGAVAVQAATAEIVPDVDEGWLEAQRVELGENLYQQEYEGRFVTTGGSFFDLDALEFDDDGPALPRDAVSWVAALDAAFHQDRFGYALLGEHPLRPNEVILGPVGAIEPVGVARSFEARRDREDATLAAVWEMLEPYRPRKVFSDVHQSAAIESYFGRLGTRVEIVQMSAPVITKSFVTLRSRLVDGSLRLYRQPQLIEDLRRVRARDNETIVLPRYAGGHCDAAAALALAVSQVSVSRSRPAAVQTLPSSLPSFLNPDRW